MAQPDFSRSSSNYRINGRSYTNFAPPPLASRPLLFCCPVAESDPNHLPRSFVNPGRHLMNTQLRSFLECADDDRYTFAKCDVSHMIEVTTRALHNNTDASQIGVLEQQWNIPLRTHNHSFNAYTPPLEETDQYEMAIDGGNYSRPAIPYSTYQSMSSRCFITQNSNDAWQIPPHSRAFREIHPEPRQGKTGRERYMEIPPFRTMPYTSESIPGGNAGAAGARPWMPSCSIVMWCTIHNNFYEVHVLS